VGGVLLPDRCSISVCGIEDEEYKESKVEWWRNVWGFNMSCIRDRAMLEPLVDSVDERSIVTDHCMILVSLSSLSLPLLLTSWKSVDLYNVVKEEINYKAPFRIKAERADNIHAIVAYFDIWFTDCHKVVHFSTGPHVKYTHWKQTVLYLNEVVYLEHGEEIVGTLASCRNKKNPRDLDIKLHYKYEGNSPDDKVEVRQDFFLR
jgi:type I protein arginine methyltransferase